jgi:hypothetical protein
MGKLVRNEVFVPALGQGTPCHYSAPCMNNKPHAKSRTEGQPTNQE